MTPRDGATPTSCPAVSVVMATIRLDDHFREAVASVLAQCSVDLEFVLVLDGVVAAPDELPDDPRVTVVALPRRGGLPAALNAGVAAARAPLVARLDADDVAAPQRLARQLEHLADRPDVVCLGTGVQTIDAAGRPLRTIAPPSGGDLRRELLRHNVLAHSTVVFRRAAFELCGGYDERCAPVEDYELWTRLALHGTIENLPDPLVDYRLHDHQASRHSPPWSFAVAQLLRSRWALARKLGSPWPVRLGRDIAWWSAQALRHLGLRRSRLAPRPSHRGRERSGVVVLTTIDASLDALLEGHLRRIADAGLGPVTAASADTGRLDAVAEREGVAVHALPFRRDPAPLADLVALVATLRLLLRLRPALVVHGTPKAALLGAVAAWITRVPARVHVWHGLRLETTRGLLRRVLRASERTALALSTHTVAVSHGLVDAATAAGLPVEGVQVLGEGSVCGVDVGHHAVGTERRRERFRAAHGIGPDELVVGFVGRVTADKGVDALVEAVRRVRAECFPVRLLLVGPLEDPGSLAASTRAALDEAWTTVTGPVDDTAEAFPSFDVSCLPSRREGLGQVVLESWASRCPVVVSDAPALRRLVDDGISGRVVPREDPEALADALAGLLRDADLRQSLALAGSERVARDFDRELVHDRWTAFYRSALEGRV